MHISPQTSLVSARGQDPLEPNSISAPLTIQSVEDPQVQNQSYHRSAASSPRMPQVDLDTNIPYTPKGTDVEIFKYYCPLCMLYFKNILKGACCGNYICFACTRDYVATKGIDNISSMKDIEINAILFAEIACPNCFTNGFHPVHVHSDEEVRDYSWNDQPGTKYYQASPVRVGETFEDLKRKMISFKQAEASSSSLQQIQSVPQQHSTTPEPNPFSTSGFRGIAMVDNSPCGISGGKTHEDDHNFHRLSSPVTDQTPRYDPASASSRPSSARRVESGDKVQDSTAATEGAEDDFVRRLMLDSSRRGSRELLVDSRSMLPKTPDSDRQSKQKDTEHEYLQGGVKSINLAELDHDLSVDRDLIHDTLSEHNDDILDMAEESMLDGSTLTLAKIDIHQSSMHSIDYSHQSALHEDDVRINPVSKVEIFQVEENRIRCASPSVDKYVVNNIEESKCDQDDLVTMTYQ